MLVTRRQRVRRPAWVRPPPDNFSSWVIYLPQLNSATRKRDGHFVATLIPKWFCLNRLRDHSEPQFYLFILFYFFLRGISERQKVQTFQWFVGGRGASDPRIRNTFHSTGRRFDSGSPSEALTSVSLNVAVSFVTKLRCSIFRFIAMVEFPCHHKTTLVNQNRSIEITTLHIVSHISDKR